MAKVPGVSLSGVCEVTHFNTLGDIGCDSDSLDVINCIVGDKPKNQGLCPCGVCVVARKIHSAVLDVLAP